MTTTWNPSDKGADVVLSGSNLVATATHPSTMGVRATASVATGKRYFETVVSRGAGTSNFSIGMANATWSVSSNQLGFDNNSIGYRADGSIYSQTVTLLFSGAAMSSSDVIGIAVDADARTIKFYKNNVLQYTASGADVPTGALFAAYSGTGAGFDSSATVNFGATATTYTPPSGYSTIDLEKYVDATLLALTIDSGTNDFVQSLPELTLSADGFTEPGFAAEMPPLTLDALAETLPYMDLVLPAMSLAATISDTASFAEDMPALTLSAELQSGEVVTVAAALPAMTLSAGTGASSEITLAPLELVATAVPGNLATLDADLPALDVAATAYQTDLWTAALTAPAITCAADLAAGNTATFNESMRALTSEGTVLSGSVSTLVEALPLLESEGTAYGASVNTMSGALPSLTLLADAVAAVSTALGNAWVMNLRNSALTQYTNFGFNSMTLFNGKYLGASDAGIVELGTLGTASGDAGTQIDASARTGSLDSDSSFMKRAPYLYVQTETDGDMVVSKISAEHGQRDFLLPWSGREGMQQRRVKTGRKSKSEFWQWEFSNRLGSYIRVASFDAMAQRTGRRVQ